jgi:hypothetical protein
MILGLHQDPDMRMIIFSDQKMMPNIPGLRTKFGKPGLQVPQIWQTFVLVLQRNLWLRVKVGVNNWYAHESDVAACFDESLRLWCILSRKNDTFDDRLHKAISLMPNTSAEFINGISGPYSMPSARLMNASCRTT